MAHESFEDDETAKIMNEKFINIKISPKNNSLLKSKLSISNKIRSPDIATNIENDL